MDKFIDTYEPPKLNQEDIIDVNRSSKSNKTEATIKSVPIKEASRLTDPLLNSFSEITPKPMRPCHRIERERMVGNSSKIPSIAPSPKRVRTKQRKKTIQTSF